MYLVQTLRNVCSSVGGVSVGSVGISDCLIKHFCFSQLYKAGIKLAWGEREREGERKTRNINL